MGKGYSLYLVTATKVSVAVISESSGELIEVLAPDSPLYCCRISKWRLDGSSKGLIQLACTVGATPDEAVTKAVEVVRAAREWRRHA